MGLSNLVPFFWMFLALPSLAQVTTTTVQSSAPTQLAERPPQFVVLAFDGSYAESVWKDTIAAADDLGVKFTYFISGVYFLRNDRKETYLSPQRKPGSSDIGFGGTAAEIEARMAQVLIARARGHEIASHANGHFDGSKWTEEQWDAENLQFDGILRNALKLNDIGSPLQRLWVWPTTISMGFRAPHLSHSPGLFPSLKKFGYLYDTSRIATWNYWPQKISGVWNYPLASLEIAGSGKRTLSMDYNFYVAHSGAKSRPESTLLFEKEMLETYLRYFQRNYNGPRAPIHIGHHFSYWNGGAYWRALKKFAKETCGLPEVRCVTYAELTAWMSEMESRKPNDPRGTLEQLRAGQFPSSPETILFRVSEENGTVLTKTKTLKVPVLPLHQKFGSRPGRILSDREVRSLGLKTDHGRVH